MFIERLAASLTVSCLLVASATAGERGAGVVSSDHALASACGAEILERGGNAADAAVATALCAGVVQPSASGLGGGGFAVVVDAAHPTGRVLDFREVAPAAAHRDLFVRDGVVDPEASKTGGLAVAVPGQSRGLAQLLREHGSLPPRVVAAPAIRLARRGFPVGAWLAGSLERVGSEEVRAAFSVDGRPARLGDVLRQPVHARTLRRWAATAGEDLHTGPGAAVLADHVRGHDGLVTPEDLAAYAVRVRDPVVIRWRDHTVITMPPPSSGGVALAQTLRVLEGQDLRALGYGSAAYLHLLAETMKHAYADRAHHLGDPDFVDVPVARLLSDERVASIRAAFDPERTFPAEHYGPLVAPPRDAGTEHLSVWDGRGGAVALTTTVNTPFGAELVPPALGIVLNDQMDDFVAAPGVPNAYGLVGGEANAIAPGKRPLSSMTPTVVLDREGRPVLVIGASGGSRIISATLQVLLAVLEFGLPPDIAVAEPRIHHQWQPDRLFVEGRIPPEVRAGLEARGHVLVVEDESFSAVQAVFVWPDGSGEGAAEPRKDGRPAEAWPRR